MTFLIFLRQEMLKELPKNIIVEEFEENKSKGLQVVAYPIKEDRIAESNIKRAA